MIVEDPAEAVRRARLGESVVLMVASDSRPVDLPDGLPGRIAVFAGAFSNVADRHAAQEMAEELFGR